MGEFLYYYYCINMWVPFLSVLQVSTGEPSKPFSFTFVPVVQELPIKSIVTAQERSGALTGKQDKVQVKHTPRRQKSNKQLVLLIC